MGASGQRSTVARPWAVDWEKQGVAGASKENRSSSRPSKSSRRQRFLRAGERPATLICGFIDEHRARFESLRSAAPYLSTGVRSPENLLRLVQAAPVRALWDTAITEILAATRA